MRTAIYSRRGPAADVLSVAERPMPRPKDDEVLVRVAFSGVNPSDVKSRAGVSARGADEGEVIPHSDGAGVVDAVGPIAPKSLLGQRVWVFNAQWQRPHGTAAQYVALPARQVVPLPDAVPLEVGASIGIPLMTAFHAVQSLGSLLGRTVLVPGAAGSVGYYATQLAAQAGARVIASVSSDEKARIALSAGADVVVNYRSEDLVQRVRELTQGHGVDGIVEVDAAGHAPKYGELLAFGGKAVVYGSSARQIELAFGPMILGFASLYFFIVYKLPPEVLRQTIEGVTSLLQRERLRHPPVAVFGLDEIAAAHERVEQGADAKVLVKP